MCGTHGDRELGARTGKFWWGKGGGRERNCLDGWFCTGRRARNRIPGKMKDGTTGERWKVIREKLFLCWSWFRVSLSTSFHPSEIQSASLFFFLPALTWAGIYLFIFPFIFISWRLITLQYCSGFCHTLTWISHGFTCIPHPDPPSHLPLHPIPLSLPNAPGPSTCIMHPAWAGDLFHPK